MSLSVPKALLHLEGLVVLIAACVAYRSFGASWYKFGILFLAPDLSMLGYLFGKKVGAIAYNCVHTYVGPFLLCLLAHLANLPALFPLCIIWLAHIGLDRLLGYGLKYGIDFKTTHLHRV